MTDLRKAAEMALEALEGIHVGNMTPMAEENWNKALTALRQALAQPEQEPVAYMSIVKKDSAFDKFRFVQSDMYPTPVYTAPPKRQWVGLTLDDMPETYAGDRSFLHGARWAEAKLKEKNT